MMIYFFSSRRRHTRSLRDWSSDVCSSDLRPELKVSAVAIYNQHSGDFEFRPGPVFTNILLADEINRATPRTQAALLEAMQRSEERRVGKECRSRGGRWQ